jgi:hypothetical protein
MNKNQNNMISMSVMPQINNIQNVNNAQNKINMNIISQNQNQNKMPNMIQNISSHISKISLQIYLPCIETCFTSLLEFVYNIFVPRQQSTPFGLKYKHFFLSFSNSLNNWSII